MGEGPVAYQDDQGAWCYRLSAWGGCIRDLVACRQGITPMPSAGEPEPYLREGHLHEADVVSQLQASGYSVTDQQAEVVLEIPPGKIVGHLDGRLTRSGERPRVLEIKAPGKAVFAEVEAMGVASWVAHHQQYSWQVSGAMWGGLGKATVVVKSRDSGKVLSEDIDIPPKTLEDFQQRMDEIEKWCEVDRLPPCEKAAWCWKGPYRHVHYKEDAPRDPIPIHETRNKAIEELTEQLDKTRKRIRAEQQKEDELKEELLGMTGVGIYVTDHHKVTIREVNTTRMDQKAVRAEHGDKYDVEVTYPSIRIDQR